MTTTLALRIAASISLLFTLGHSLGGLQKWSPNADNPVLRAMTDVHFDMMGMNRSYLDLYLGLGWSISVAMLLQTVLLWQLASLREDRCGAGAADDRGVPARDRGERNHRLAAHLPGAGDLLRRPGPGARLCLLDGGQDAGLEPRFRRREAVSVAGRNGP